MSQVCFVNFILYTNLNDFIWYPVYVYVHNICEEKFGGYTKSFSWLCQKVNKNQWQRCVWPRCQWLWLGLVPMATGWRPILARHLNTIQYSNRIRNHWIFVFNSVCIRNFKDIRIEWDSIFIPSLIGSCIYGKWFTFGLTKIWSLYSTLLMLKTI